MWHLFVLKADGWKTYSFRDKRNADWAMGFIKRNNRQAFCVQFAPGS